jgi:hypothetical protein
MTEFELYLQRELSDMNMPPTHFVADWGDVLRRVKPQTAPRATRQGFRSRRLRFALCAVVLAGLIGTVSATSLGSTLTRAFDGFAAWVTGHPGAPASNGERLVFQKANERSWATFPPDTELRRLLAIRASDSSFVLFGFRSDDLLCLRLVATGPVEGSATDCVPIQALQNADKPVIVAASDEPFGFSEPTRNGGGSLTASATFGIASDGVSQIVLASDDGDHFAVVKSNAFLYIAEHRTAETRIHRVSAVAANGSVVAIPVRPAPLGTAESRDQDRTPAQGPTGVDRKNVDGSIDWIQAGALRGKVPSPALESQLRHSFKAIALEREITPDPRSPMSVIVVFGQSQHSLGANDQLCVYLLFVNSLGGGCSAFDGMFSQQPFTAGIGAPSGAGQYVFVSGAASDDVEAIKVYLSNGVVADAALSDNVYVLPVARYLFPIRIVALDQAGEIIGNQVISSDGLEKPTR